MSQQSQVPFYHLKYCQLIRWKSYFDGTSFGFSFFTLRDGSSGLPIHFVGKIDIGSPAHYSGLREDDQLLQINGYDVCDMAHKRVQDVVKKSPQMISLLIGDRDSIRYIRDHGFVICDRSRDYAVQFVSASPEPVLDDPSERRKSGMMRRFSLNLSAVDGRTSSPRSFRKKLT